MKPLNTDPINELISAISALNTYPDYDDRLKEEEYISDTIPAVEHAIEHIRAAIALIEDKQWKPNI